MRKIFHSFGLRIRNFLHSKMKSKINQILLTKGTTTNEYNKELIVTFTSMASRLNKIQPCLESLLTQSLKPNKIVLWLTEGEFNDCSPKAKALLSKYEKRGLEIRTCEQNIRSYKKIFYSLKCFPDAVLVTADDDHIYPRNWLKRLWEAYLDNPGMIHCHRAHYMTFSDSGKLNPYDQWEWEEVWHHGPSLRLFPTGCRGVLYPPGSLHRRVTEMEFLRLCPDNDDIWLKTMSLLQGTKCIQLEQIQGKDYFLKIYNPGTPHLWHRNVLEKENDSQLTRIFQEYSLMKILQPEISQSNQIEADKPELR